MSYEPIPDGAQRQTARHIAMMFVGLGMLLGILAASAYLLIESSALVFGVVMTVTSLFALGLSVYGYRRVNALPEMDLATNEAL